MIQDTDLINEVINNKKKDVNFLLIKKNGLFRGFFLFLGSSLTQLSK